MSKFAYGSAGVIDPSTCDSIARCASGDVPGRNFTMMLPRMNRSPSAATATVAALGTGQPRRIVVAEPAIDPGSREVGEQDRKAGQEPGILGERGANADGGRAYEPCRRTRA